MKRAVFTALFCAAALLRCSQLTGGGDDFPNAIITGALVNTDGTPATQSVVRLIPATYDPVRDEPIPEAQIDTTDANGRYRFQIGQTGVFNVFGSQVADGKMAFVKEVGVFEKDVPVPTDTLRYPGTVIVVVPAGSDTLGGYVYVPGSLIFRNINPYDPKVILDSVPAGTLPAIFYASRNYPGFRVLRYSVDVPSNDYTVIVRPGWLYSRRLYLNTTSSGAGVNGNVVKFPLLVRLSRDVFDFSKAAATGADIRFARADASTLPYEIERWDASLGRAEIWVKVDIVHGNNASQYIEMFWGNPSAPDSSHPSAVFDTTAGYQGVWHLGEKSGAISKDATANRFDGMPKNMGPASDIAGAIGIAQEFNGTSSFIQMPGTASGKLNFPASGVYTVSAWAYTDTLGIGYRMIASKGDYQYNLEIMDSTDNWEFAERKDETGWEVTLFPATAKVWTHLVGVRNGTYQYLYVNGACVDSTIELLYPGLGRNTSFDFMIGKLVNQNAYFFDGKIDEVRVCSVAPNADRIRLEYMNQKAQDALVVFDKR